MTRIGRIFTDLFFNIFSALFKVFLSYLESFRSSESYCFGLSWYFFGNLCYHRLLCSNQLSKHVREHKSRSPRRIVNPQSMSFSLNSTLIKRRSVNLWHSSHSIFLVMKSNSDYNRTSKKRKGEGISPFDFSYLFSLFEDEEGYCE